MISNSLKLKIKRIKRIIVILFYMKWYEVIVVILAFGALVQLFIWILNSLGLKETLSSTIIFLISAIFSLILTIILILNQVQNDLREIKTYLKKQGFEEPDGFIQELVKKMRDKNGVIKIDSRTLWIIVILIILYLLWKSGVFGSR